MKITNDWFYSDTKLLSKALLIYVKGDGIVFVPFYVFLAVFYLFNQYLAIKIFISFFTVRALGEMIYWLFQQFGDKSYRPYDFGLKDLNNNAIYILYQIIGCVLCGIGLALLLTF